MREAATPMIPEMKQGYNVILIAKASVVDSSFQDLCESVHQILVKAGLLYN